MIVQLCYCVEYSTDMKCVSSCVLKANNVVIVPYYHNFFIIDPSSCFDQVFENHRAAWVASLSVSHSFLLHCRD